MKTHFPKDLVVGDIVRVGNPCLDNLAGATAVVIEVYQLGGRTGWSLLFANGNHDGFSWSDLDLWRVKKIGHDTGVARYQFENAVQLLADFRRGQFASVWSDTI